MYHNWVLGFDVFHYNNKIKIKRKKLKKERRKNRIPKCAPFQIWLSNFRSASIAYHHDDVERTKIIQIGSVALGVCVCASAAGVHNKDDNLKQYSKMVKTKIV